MPDRYSDPHESLDPPDPPEPFDFEPTRDLPGAVFMIPNRHWGFEVVSAVDHPGTCLHYSQTRHDGLLLQGTDANNVLRSHGYYVVMPTAENGLQIPTAFRLTPQLLSQDIGCGCISPSDTWGGWTRIRCWRCGTNWPGSTRRSDPSWTRYSPNTFGPLV
jgi:hypothetical protein